MKALLKGLTIGLLLLVPLSAARAQGPLLSPIANVSVNAGGTLSVNVIAVDPQDRPVTVTAALPPFATLNAPTLATGVVLTSVTLTPTGAQVGDYSAAVTATAGGVSNVRVFQITVNAAGSDRAPVVTAPLLQQVSAGSGLTVMVSASDPDGDAIASLSASGLPAGASFTPNGSNTAATFSWTPGAGDVGEYDVQFLAANALSGSTVTHIRVTSAPSLAITPIANVTVADGSFASVPVHASGVPGALITLTAALPAFATLNPPGTGTGSVSTTVTVSPPTGSAGTYHASITAISQGTSVTEPFDIIVTGVVGPGDHPPVLSAPATATVAIGSTLSFDVTASDPDSDHVDLFGSALPPGSGFTDHANDTGTFTWTPVDGQAGTYTASFTGTDGRGGSGSASTIITVTGGTQVNHPPTLSAPATEQVSAGVVLSFTVSATDPDGDHVALSASSLPAGASFSDNGNDTGTFSWAPGASQIGSYTVSFLGFDGRGGTGTANTGISVVVANSGGTGGVVPGHACVIGKFTSSPDSLCFRMRPVHHSFDPADVVLSSIRLWFHGDSIPALGGARVDIDCRSRGHHGDGALGNGDDEPGDDPPDEGLGNDCGLICKDHGDDNDDGACDTLGIRACFTASAVLQLLSGGAAALAHDSPAHKRLLCALIDAELRATLANGGTVVAKFGRDNDDDGQGDDDDSQGHGGSGHDGVLRPQLKPNPLNPATQLSFTTTQSGDVRVAVYDMQGRLVKRLLNEFRSSGAQTVAWDGTDERSRRVPSGVYFIRVQAPEGFVTRSVAVVR